jgi:hypothetical protein
MNLVCAIPVFFCAELLSRRLGTVHGPAAVSHSVGQSVSQSVSHRNSSPPHTSQHASYSFHTFRLYLGLPSNRLPRRFLTTTQSVFIIFVLHV